MSKRFYFVILLVAFAVPVSGGVKLDRPEPEYGLLLGVPAEGVGVRNRLENLRAAKEALDRARGDDATVARAYLDASVCYEAAGEYEKAAKYAEKAAKKHPETSVAAGAFFRAGVMLEKCRKYKDAAKRFEKVWREPLYARLPDDEYETGMNLGEAAYVQAGVCREAAGDLKGAVKVYRAYLDEPGPHPARRVWAYYRLGRALAARGKEDEARAAFSAAAELYRDLAENTVLDMEPAVPYAAGAEFYSAEYDYLKFRDTELKLPQDRMERDLERMLSASQRLVAVYNGVIEYEYAGWTVAAYCRLGDVYSDFADALDEAELPEEIDPRHWRKKKLNDPERLEREEKYNNYAKALEEQTGPLRAKAVEFYEAATAIAGALGLTGPWVERARTRYREMTELEG